MTKQTDFCLAMMPYQAVERPSPAMGILLATVRKAGFHSFGTYPGLRFAEKIGPRAYRQLENSYRNLLGEWSFSRAAFPDAPDDPEQYYQLLQATNLPGAALPFSLEELLEIRAAASEFVHEEALRILEQNPTMVGCGSQFQQHCASLALLREVKRLSPRTLTLLGGQCCSGDQGLATWEAAPWLDYVFSGEADHGLPQLLSLIRKHGKQIPQPELPVGVIGASGFRSDHHGAPSYAITPDMNALPVPDHDDYFRELELWPHKDGVIPYLAFEGGRGCDWAHRTGGCTFCATAQERARFRPKSSARLLQELYTLKEKYDTAAFEAADEMCSPEFFRDFFPVLAKEEKPPFLLSFDIRATMGETEVRLLRDSGCVWLQPGIESLSDEALHWMRKGITSVTALRLLRLNLENGIGTSWNILRGFPGERPEWYGQMAQLIPALFHLEPPNACGALRIDRNSLYQQKPEQFGLKLRPARFYAHIYPLPEEHLLRLASFFENANGPTGLPGNTPEVQLLELLIQDWKRLFENPATRPELVIDDLPSSAGSAAPAATPTEETRPVAQIRDTRPCAVQLRTPITALQRRLLNFCRNPQPFRALVTLALAQGVGQTAREISDAASFLQSRRFLVHSGQMILTVVANQPRYPLPTPEEILTGNIPF